MKSVCHFVEVRLSAPPSKSVEVRRLPRHVEVQGRSSGRRQSWSPSTSGSSGPLPVVARSLPRPDAVRCLPRPVEVRRLPPPEEVRLPEEVRRLPRPDDVRRLPPPEEVRLPDAVRRLPRPDEVGLPQGGPEVCRLRSASGTTLDAPARPPHATPPGAVASGSAREASRARASWAPPWRQPLHWLRGAGQPGLSD